MRRGLVAVVGWLAAAALAVATGMLAVSLLGSAIAGQGTRTVSEQAVDSALEQARQDTGPSAGSTTPPESTAKAPSGQSVTRALETPGGTVLARCRADGKVYLVSWTPRQGFEIEDSIRGPARSAYVLFDSEDREVHLTVSCQHHVPDPHVASEHDD